MSKKGIIVRVIMVVVAVLFNIGIMCYSVSPRTQDVTVEIDYESGAANTLELFYLGEQDEYKDGFKSGLSSSVDYDETMINSSEKLQFKISGDTTFIRLDFGMGISPYTNVISNIRLNYGGDEITIPTEYVFNIYDMQDVNEVVVGTNNLKVIASGEDPYIVWDTAEWGIRELISDANTKEKARIKIILCVVLDIFILVSIIWFDKLLYFPKELWNNKKLIIDLSKNDFKTKYAGSYLGIIWAFIQPIVTVLVYWFVFEKGLKAGASLTKSGIEVPFALWLVAGIVPWFFFQDALVGGMNALVEYSYLVKKVVFKIDILPVVKVMSAAFVHAFFVGFTLVLFAVYHYYPDIYTLQIVYYSFAAMMLVLGLSYAASAITVFFRDLTQIINIILQVGMWMTPIMWNVDTMELSPWLIRILKLNPMYYIVIGYRQSLIDKRWIWENPGMTVYFWAVTLVIFFVGTNVFKKLKIHFADVL